MPVATKLELLDADAKKTAAKTRTAIVKLEGGPDHNTARSNGFYAAPMWVAEALGMRDAKDAFDAKNLGEDTAPERIFMLPYEADVPLPEDRFNEYRMHFSYTRLDWYRHKTAAEQAAIKKAVYGQKGCPRLTNEWEYMTKHAMRQAQVPRTWRTQSPGTALACFRFVQPVVHMIQAKAPNAKMPFQLRFDPVRRCYFYIGFGAGLAKNRLAGLQALVLFN